MNDIIFVQFVRSCTSNGPNGVSFHSNEPRRVAETEVQTGIRELRREPRRQNYRRSSSTNPSTAKREYEHKNAQLPDKPGRRQQRRSDEFKRIHALHVHAVERNARRREDAPVLRGGQKLRRDHRPRRAAEHPQKAGTQGQTPHDEEDNEENLRPARRFHFILKLHGVFRPDPRRTTVNMVVSSSVFLVLFPPSAGALIAVLRPVSLLLLR